MTGRHLHAFTDVGASPSLFPMRLSLAARLSGLMSLAFLAATAVVVLVLVHVRDLVRDQERMMSHDVHAELAAREAQVAFKIQVQEWKNVLLRGRDNAALSKYRTAFIAEGNRVIALTDTLAGLISDTVALRRCGSTMALDGRSRRSHSVTIRAPHTASTSATSTRTGGRILRLPDRQHPMHSILLPGRCCGATLPRLRGVEPTSCLRISSRFATAIRYSLGRAALPTPR